MNSTNFKINKIYECFPSANFSISSDNLSMKDSSFNNDKENENLISDDQYFYLFKDVLKNKREAKLLRKIHEEMFDIYLCKMRQINHKTAKFYWNAISKFMIYSPSLNPDELKPFLRKKFYLNKTCGSLKNNLKGTALKYYHCLNGFLKRVYVSEYSKLNINWAEALPVKISLKSKTTLTLIKLINAYVELMNSNNVEDAIIIHLMYSLALTPEAISLLIFNSIDENGILTYWDAKEKKYIDAKLNSHLLRDLMFLKNKQIKNKSYVKSKTRLFKNKINTSRDFMVSISASGIYNRFARKFGGKIDWFDFTPKDIINLSLKKFSTVSKFSTRESLDFVEESIDSLC